MARTCKIEDCNSKLLARELCSKHYQRWKHHGDPYMVLPHTGSAPGINRGASNPNWAGDDVSYNAMHTRIGSKRGPAYWWECVDCGEQAEEWSLYDRAAANRVDPKGRPYSTNIGDYVSRCVPCHRAFDKAVR